MTLCPRALLLDMDGVLYHGERVLPHAPAFLARADWDAPDLAALYRAWRAKWPDCFDAADGLHG